jgi:hypothetical protein
LKHQRIRDYVAADPARILFDYADILCYNDDGSTNTDTWNGHIFPMGTSNNVYPLYTGHISYQGGLRLGKAIWWMLARIAGWDGGTVSIPVTSITVTGSGGATTISTSGGTLQLSAVVLPANASNKTVTWSVTNGTGQATISTGGLVTVVSDGTVTARATATDGSNIFGTLTLTISNQIILVTEINITGEGGLSSITSDKGTLQLIATILPYNATDQSVTWTESDGTGFAFVSSTGLVTTITSGIVTVRATANDSSGVSGIIYLTISKNSDDPLTAIVDENEIRIPTQENYWGNKISLYDIYGRLMSTEFVDSNLCIFDISLFHPGLYIADMSDKMIIKVVKVIIP